MTEVTFTPSPAPFPDASTATLASEVREPRPVPPRWRIPTDPPAA